MRFLVAVIGIAPETESPDHERQRQTLTDERYQDHGERDDDDRIARRRRAGGHRDRQRERRGERDHAANAGPRKHDRLPQTNAPLTLRQELAEAQGRDPDRADNDERDAHEDTDGRELEQGRAVHPSRDARDLHG